MNGYHYDAMDSASSPTVPSGRTCLTMKISGIMKSRILYHYDTDFDNTADELDTFLQIAVNGVRKNVLFGKKMEEPDYTAAIVTEFPEIVRKYSHHTKWKIGACFTHQRPYVAFTYSKGGVKRCELADLLLVCHKKIDGRDLYNAALMQLKMSGRLEAHHSIRKESELVQLELYEYWPEFSFKLNPRVRYNVLPKCASSCAQYMFVNRHSEPLFTHAIPSTTMRNDPDYSLGRYLVAFTHWQTYCTRI